LLLLVDGNNSALRCWLLTCELDHGHAPDARPDPSHHDGGRDDLQEGSSNIDEEPFALVFQCVWKTKGEEGSEKGTQTGDDAEYRQDDGDGEWEHRQRFSENAGFLLDLEDFPSQLRRLPRRVDFAGLRLRHDGAF